MSKSLMILAFPRSMSSLTANIVGQSLSETLRYPEERSAEVLIQRYGAPSNNNHCRDLSQYDKYEKILDGFKDGWLIKDVNQPFMATEYLRQNPRSFTPLFIERPLADNIYCLFKNGWFWPINSTIGSAPGTELFLSALRKQPGGIGRNFKPTTFHRRQALPRLIDACLLIDKECYKNIPNRIKYDDLCRDERILNNKLRELGFSPKENHYINDSFKKKLARTKEYRTKPLWNFIDGYLRAKLQDFDARR